MHSLVIRHIIHGINVIHYTYSTVNKLSLESERGGYCQVHSVAVKLFPSDTFVQLNFVKDISNK